MHTHLQPTPFTATRSRARPHRRPPPAVCGAQWLGRRAQTSPPAATAPAGPAAASAALVRPEHASKQDLRAQPIVMPARRRTCQPTGDRRQCRGLYDRGSCAHREGRDPRKRQLRSICRGLHPPRHSGMAASAGTSGAVSSVALDCVRWHSCALGAGPRCCALRAVAMACWCLRVDCYRRRSMAAEVDVIKAMLSSPLW
jgi:hypothetical protein